ncbi:hypothetical protein [Pseudokineococcus sp. 1T1Z-3]|uniref:hypothetical protein n=1 Tax=Pseudokineococcus sp. 1T1Z-3 TaxID=3132745 RepID=UPI0030A1DC0B
MLAGALAAPVLAMDDLYPGWDGLAAGSRRLEEVLTTWRRGEGARLLRWSWVRDRLTTTSPLVVAPGPLLVVEGVGAGTRGALAPGDVLLWLEAPDDVRRARALARDGDAYAPHWARWAAQEEAHLAAHDPRGRADVVVRT